MKNKPPKNLEKFRIISGPLASSIGKGNNGAFIIPYADYDLFHPKDSEYVNFNPNVLHMWRQQNKEIEIPPSWMVGPKR